MTAPQIYRLFPYRVRRGDLQDKAFPIVGTEDLEGAAKQLLLNLFNAPRRPGEKPPHTADVVDEEGHIAFTVEVRASNEAVLRLRKSDG